MEDTVLVLTDEHGHLYIIGKDTLDQTRVRNEEHISVVRELVGATKGKAKQGARSGSGIQVLGGYEVAKDRFLKSVRLTPNYVILTPGAEPA